MIQKIRFAVATALSFLFAFFTVAPTTIFGAYTMPTNLFTTFSAGYAIPYEVVSNNVAYNSTYTHYVYIPEMWPIENIGYIERDQNQNALDGTYGTLHLFDSTIFNGLHSKNWYALTRVNSNAVYYQVVINTSSTYTSSIIDVMSDYAFANKSTLLTNITITDTSLSYDAGYDDGFQAGVDTYEDTLLQETTNAYNLGFDDGFDEGLLENNADAYNAGYADGLEDTFATGLPTWIIPLTILFIAVGGFLALRRMRE